MLRLHAPAITLSAAVTFVAVVSPPGIVGGVVLVTLVASVWVVSYWEKLRRRTLSLATALMLVSLVCVAAFAGLTHYRTRLRVLEGAAETVQALEKQVASLRDELQVTANRFAPRRVTAGAKETMVAELKSIPGQQVSILYTMDDETMTFAADLKEIFQRAGWLIAEDIIQGMGVRRGVSVRCAPRDKAALLFTSALRGAGLSVEFEEDPEQPAEMFRVIVGNKPL